MRIGRRLVLLASVGVAMTLAVVVTAFVLVSEVSDVNRQLAQVSVALNHHKTADEMHDALRADVARAQLVGAGRLDVRESQIRRETDAHATRYQAAVRAVARIPLPPRLERTLGRLGPFQDIYIVTARQLVRSALSSRGVIPGAESDYEASYKTLAPAQHRVTTLLMATTARVEQDAARQRRRAEGTIGFAAVAALGGWLALAGWHHRSLRQLREALVREADHRAAADLLQRSLMPESLPQVDGTRLAARSVPGNVRNRIGGDWYDAIHLPSGQLLLVVGDVVGHDLPAAAVMGQLRNALRAYALEDHSPATILSRVNRAALLFQSSDMATCIVVAIDTATMRASWASAGHPPPLITSPQAPPRLLAGAPGPPLGVIAEAKYPEHQVLLEDGDSMLLYSDGLVERRGFPIDVGLARLSSIDVPDAGPDETCGYVLSTMLEHGANRDDVTCLFLRVELPSSHPDSPSRTSVGTPPTYA